MLWSDFSVHMFKLSNTSTAFNVSVLWSDLFRVRFTPRHELCEAYPPAEASNRRVSCFGKTVTSLIRIINDWQENKVQRTEKASYLQQPTHTHTHTHTQTHTHTHTHTHHTHVSKDLLRPLLKSSTDLDTKLTLTVAHFAG